MKRIILATAALALTGCMSIPVTQTAANDDACLRQSVAASVEMPPVVPREVTTPRQPKSTKCKSMGSTWSGVGSGNQHMDPGHSSN